MSTYQLAQCNIARLRAPLDSPALSGFVGALDSINALAERTSGFVWRLQTEDGNATSIRAFDDDMLLINMSVWESVEALGAFVYNSEHREIMRGRRQWFERMVEAYLVLWWVPTGVRPTTMDARERLDALRRDGPTPHAFTFRAPFPAPDEHDAPRPRDDWFCAT